MVFLTKWDIFNKMDMMEIVEIVSHSVEQDKGMILVSFRCITDPEDMSRIAEIELNEITDYGFEIFDTEFDIFDEWYEEDDEDSNDINEQELLSFLNEYYMINPKLLPKPELY